MTTQSGSKKKSGKVAKIGVLAIVGLVAYAFGSVALGPEWIVNGIQNSGKTAVVTCYKKWHKDDPGKDYLHKVTVTAAVAASLKDGDACPS